MKTRIIWSEDAGNDLSKINARNIYNKIMDKINEASGNAEGRRIAPLLKEFGITDIHQINVNPWIIYYRADNNLMKIIAIIDMRRNLEEILYQKIMEGKIK